jgi:hypothetical protein
VPNHGRVGYLAFAARYQVAEVNSSPSQHQPTRVTNIRMESTGATLSIFLRTIVIANLRHDTSLLSQEPICHLV